MARGRRHAKGLNSSITTTKFSKEKRQVNGKVNGHSTLHTNKRNLKVEKKSKELRLNTTPDSGVFMTPPPSTNNSLNESRFSSTPITSGSLFDNQIKEGGVKKCDQKLLDTRLTRTCSKRDVSSQKREVSTRKRDRTIGQHSSNKRRNDKTTDKTSVIILENPTKISKQNSDKKLNKNNQRSSSRILNVPNKNRRVSARLNEIEQLKKSSGSTFGNGTRKTVQNNHQTTPQPLPTSTPCHTSKPEKQNQKNKLGQVTLSPPKVSPVQKLEDPNSCMTGAVISSPCDLGSSHLQQPDAKNDNARLPVIVLVDLLQPTSPNLKENVKSKFAQPLSCSKRKRSEGMLLKDSSSVATGEIKHKRHKTISQKHRAISHSKQGKQQGDKYKSKANFTKKSRKKNESIEDENKENYINKKTVCSQRKKKGTTVVSYQIKKDKVKTEMDHGVFDYDNEKYEPVGKKPKKVSPKLEQVTDKRDDNCSIFDIGNYSLWVFFFFLVKNCDVELCYVIIIGMPLFFCLICFLNKSD